MPDDDDGTVCSDEWWGEQHQRAMANVDDAELFERGAKYHWREAAKLEELAVKDVPEGKPKSRAILQRSAVSLWFRAGKPNRAIKLAREYLEGEMLPGFRAEMEAVVAVKGAKLDDDGRPPHKSGS